MFNFRSLIFILIVITIFTGITVAQTKPQTKKEIIDEEIRRQIEQALPLLPQEPIAKKEKTDAQDENVKGKVKSIIQEREDLSGAGKDYVRSLSLATDFNESGDFLRRVYFDSKGYPMYLMVYGYIDGVRASNSKILSNSNGGSGRTSESIIEEKKRPDFRYQSKYEYKYANGKLAEIQLFSNTGSMQMRYVYNYNGNRLEELVYTKDGKLNQNYLRALDESGNEIERTNVAVLRFQNGKDNKYSFSYNAYDENGNWIERIISNVEIENGKEIYKPIAMEYRTITYYP